jgi:hypothetical protein
MELCVGEENVQFIPSRGRFWTERAENYAQHNNNNNNNNNNKLSHAWSVAPTRRLCWPPIFIAVEPFL